jgi:hypothetical protein
MKGIVYQIYSDSYPDIIYVGSTINTLEKRWQNHKSDFKNKKRNGPVICQYFEKFGIDLFQIRVIKEYDVVDNNHLLVYEQLWIHKLKTINIVKNLFLRTKMIIQMQNKLYYEENKESISEKHKLYMEENKEYFSEYQKLYRENNREYNKTYYENNREHIIERALMLYTCQCSPDKQLTHGNKARHERSKKHQKYLQSLEETKE